MSQTAEWRVHQRAQVLLSKSQGSTDLAASVHAGCSESTVSRVVARYREGKAAPLPAARVIGKVR